MIAHLEGLIKTNNFVPHQFCSKTNITPPGVENQGQMGQFREIRILTDPKVPTVLLVVQS